MNQDHNSKLITCSSYFSVIIAVIIMFIKIYGWFSTESPSVLASMIDSMLDVSSSFINLIAIKISLRPPDNNHRFGHEKFQDLAIFSQSMFFLASCLFAIFSAIKVLILHEVSENQDVGMNSMLICIFLTALLVLYQSYVIKRTNSQIIAADRLHYFSDFITNIAVILSLYLAKFAWYLDAVIAIGIAIYIAINSYKLFKHAIRNLVDEELPVEQKKKIIDSIKKHSEVLGVHELKTRYAAEKIFIQFHIELDANMTLYDAHKIADKVSDDLNIIFPTAEILIHQDPNGYEENVMYREKL